MDFLKKVLKLEDLYKPKSNHGDFAQPKARASRAHERRLSRKEKRQTDLLERRRITIMDLSTESIKSPAKSKIKPKIEPKKNVKPPEENQRWKMLQKWKAEKEAKLKKEAEIKKPIFRPAGATIPKNSTTLTTTFGLQNKSTFIAPKNIKPIPLNNEKLKVVVTNEASKKVTKAPTITSSRITRSQDPVKKNLTTKTLLNTPKYSTFNKNINANSTINSKFTTNKTIATKPTLKSITSKFKLPNSKPLKRKSLSNKENQKGIDNLVDLGSPKVKNKKRRSILTEKNTTEINTEPTEDLTDVKKVPVSPEEPRMKTRGYMERLKNNALNNKFTKPNNLIKGNENLGKKSVSNKKVTTEVAQKKNFSYKSENLTSKLNNKVLKNDLVKIISNKAGPLKQTGSTISKKNVKSSGSVENIVEKEKSKSSENIDVVSVETTDRNIETVETNSSVKSGSAKKGKGAKKAEENNENEGQITLKTRKSRKSISTASLETPQKNLTPSKLTPKQRRETIFDVNTSLDEQRLRETLNPRPKNNIIKKTRKSISAIELEKISNDEKSQNNTPKKGRKSITNKKLNNSESSDKENLNKSKRNSKIGSKMQDWDVEKIGTKSRKSIGTKKNNLVTPNLGSPKNVRGTPKSKTSKKNSLPDPLSVSEDLENKIETTTTNNDKFYTPEKQNEPIVYLSPFVTTSRGKRSIKPEIKSRESILIKPNFDDTPEKSNKAAAKYYHNVLDNVIKRLLGLCEKWQNIKDSDQNLPEDATDMIDVAMGQTHLLINKKFKQFRNLIYNCENGDGECPVNAVDLQGFWDMVYIQVDNLDVRFNRLEEIKANNWQEILPVVKKSAPIIKKRIPPKPKPSTTVRSSVRDAIRAARQKANNKNCLIPGDDHVVFNGGFFSVTSPAKNKVVERQTPRSKRKSLLTTVLSAEAKKTLKTKLDLNKTMPTPGRSILKKGNSAKTPNLNKTVLFADDDDL